MQVREIHASYGYMGSNDVRLTLGLAGHAAVDTLQIFWPSGVQQTLLNIDADQSIVVEEQVGP